MAGRVVLSDIEQPVERDCSHAHLTTVLGRGERVTVPARVRR
jgi:hypothetical protein